MKYAHIVNYVASSIWAIDRDKLDDIVRALAFRAAGHEPSQDDINAIVAARSDAPGPVQGKGVAVIPIRGVISHRASAMEQSSGGTSAEGIGRMLRAAAADSSIGTVIFDIDSPGGTVTGVSELAGQIYETRCRGTQKFVAHVNGLAASAAYWLASQADEIVSLPSGRAGSVGVFTVHADLSKALENEGVNVTVISAGKHKVEGQPFQPLSDEAKAFMQSQVDEAYAQFTKDIARGRGVSVADVRGGFGEGRALAAKDAKAAGLIDRIGTFEDTVSRAIGRSGGMRAEALAAEHDLRRRIEGF